MIRVVIVGGGAVAGELTHQIAEAGGESRLAQQWTRSTHRVNDLAAADLYILAVNDDAIAEISAGLPFSPGSVVAHTAGSVEMSELWDGLPHRAVIYPLQTFTRGHRIANFRNIPFFIEGDTPHALATVRATAEAIADQVVEMSSERRARLHLAAAFAGNFSNAMLSLAEEIAIDADESFDVLRPLVAETISKALAMPSPRNAQTGPARRGNMTVQARHMAILADSHPELVSLYRDISSQIWKISKKN
ncbi:MAG: DUF2520 domain-containing protein [Alistipes sp.]|jgi:predicted short-subunit dehydrogenase-like oxidoreductase (DUF2520 family)|nr:DUF2520 domain-containing protein [Alistipes sp.]